jgi:hypothetical protein
MAERDWVRLDLGEMKIAVRRKTLSRMIRMKIKLQRLDKVETWDEFFNWMTMWGLERVSEDVHTLLIDQLLGLDPIETIPLTARMKKYAK